MRGIVIDLPELWQEYVDLIEKYIQTGVRNPELKRVRKELRQCGVDRLPEEEVEEKEE